MDKGHDKGRKGQMSDREVMKLALEALDQYIEKELTFGQRYTNEGQQLLDAHAILRQALEQPEQVNVPEGWKLVPIEPTDAMLSVPVNIDLRECVTPGGVTGLDAVGLFRAWEAMIEAAPQPWDATDMAHRAGGLSMEQSTECVEPVAWLSRDDARLALWDAINKREFGNPTDDKLILDHLRKNGLWIGKYTSPPASKPWVGLTDVEWMNIVNKDHAWFGQRPEDVAHEVAKLVEAKLKEKNT